MDGGNFLYAKNIEIYVNNIYNVVIKQKAGDVLKTVEVKIEDYLYTFYEKVAAQAGRTVEQVMADALFRFAGEASMGAIGKGRKV